MNTPLKTLLTTAAILGMPSVFASDAVALGEVPQSEIDILTATLTASEQREKAVDMYVARAAEADTIARRLMAADELLSMRSINEAFVIYNGVIENPQVTIEDLLHIAHRLKWVNKEKSMDLYKAIKVHAESTDDQKITAAWRLRQLEARDEYIARMKAISDPVNGFHPQQKAEANTDLATLVAN